MASAKYQQLIAQESGPEFDAVHAPGAHTPFSGVYRCLGCGRTVVGETRRHLPPQNHHQHTAQQGTIRWQMLVKTTHTHPGI